MLGKFEKEIKSVLVHGRSSKKNKHEYNYTIHFKDGTKKDEKANINQIYSNFKKYLPADFKKDVDSSTESMDSSKEKPQKTIESVEVGELCLLAEKGPGSNKLVTPYLHLLTFNYDNGKKKHKQLSLADIEKQHGSRLDNKTMQFVLSHKCKTTNPVTTPIDSPWPETKPEKKDVSTSEDNYGEDNACTCAIS